MKHITAHLFALHLQIALQPTCTSRVRLPELHFAFKLCNVRCMCCNITQNTPVLDASGVKTYICPAKAIAHCFVYCHTGHIHASHIALCSNFAMHCRGRQRISAQQHFPLHCICTSRCNRHARLERHLLLTSSSQMARTDPAADQPGVCFCTSDLDPMQHDAANRFGCSCTHAASVSSQHTCPLLAKNLCMQGLSKKSDRCSCQSIQGLTLLPLNTAAAAYRQIQHAPRHK
jgi:hypothetical protein